MPAQYETVIGLEVHAQLLTKSKLFCACKVEFGGAPNSNVCPVCLALPGALPMLNSEAVALAVRAALALEFTLNVDSVFARKNYFYPDLPKGYQISQYKEPYAERGKLTFECDGSVKSIGITRIHMEEDAGKSTHGIGGDSVVDLNRAGVALIEIVSEPELRSSSEAAEYLRALRDILVFLGVNDGNLEEGSFRCDANVSLRPLGATELGTRTELKNLNSFRFVQRAIDVEVQRQAALLDRGVAILQETRSFDPDSGQTRTLRSKEDAHDYRYFPDPDLPGLHLTPELIASERAKVGALPRQLRQRWVAELGLSEAQAATLTQHPEYVRFFEAALQQFPDAVKLANWMVNEVLRGVELHGLTAKFSVTPRQVAELLALVESGAISGKQAKEVYAEVERSDTSPSELVRARGLRVVADEAALRALCEALVKKFPSQAEQMRRGKSTLLGFFVGQAMKETQGAADPKLVSGLLNEVILKDVISVTDDVRADVGKKEG